MILYLVENVQELEERTILNICSSKEKAIELANNYKKNFKREGYEEWDDIIDIEPLYVDSESEVFWDYNIYLLKTIGRFT